jgi:hypothetical protein
MNLRQITINPHAEGFIKLAWETDPVLTGKPRMPGEFLITARHHCARPSADRPGGTLAAHPLQDKLGQADTGAGRKVVKEVPIKMFFNSVARALTISYQAYSVDANLPVCTGNGKDARRRSVLDDGTISVETQACVGPLRCTFVHSGQANCHREVRMPVQIDGQSNPLTVFEVRTASLNTYRAVRGQLLLIEKRFGGLRHVPLKLTLWQSSNQASGFEPFTLMQLSLNSVDEFAAMAEVKAMRIKYTEAGLGDGDWEAEPDDLQSDLGAASAEFAGVSEMHQEPTHAVSARAGTSVRSPTPAPGAAALAISNAVRPLAAARPLHLRQSPVSTGLRPTEVLPLDLPRNPADPPDCAEDRCEVHPRGLTRGVDHFVPELFHEHLHTVEQ